MNKYLGLFLVLFLSACTLPNKRVISTIEDPRFSPPVKTSAVDATKRSPSNYDPKSDYAEIAVSESQYPEIVALASELQMVVKNAGDLTAEKLSSQTVQSDATGDHCGDLWKVTCSKEVGFDPTGYSFASKSILFDDLVPGFKKLLEPKLLEVINFLYENDYDYKMTFDKIFSAKEYALKSAKLCLAEYISQRAFTEFSSFPLPCFQGNRMLLHDLVYFDDSLYVENRVRRAVRSEFPKSSAMRQIETEIFPRVKKLILERVEKFLSKTAVRDQIVQKLNTMKFKVKDCSNFNMNNAMYLADLNEFTICYGNALKNRSLFANVATLAHELSHSFDPCVISHSFKDFAYSDVGQIEIIDAEYPFKSVVACLAREESVGARMLTVPPAVCESQLGESFADLMAADVLPEYIQLYASNIVKEPKDYRAGYENLWRSFCGNAQDPTRLSNEDVHPRSVDRVNFILAANKKGRRLMGCSPVLVPAYCPFVTKVKK